MAGVGRYWEHDSSPRFMTCSPLINTRYRWVERTISYVRSLTADLTQRAGLLSARSGQLGHYNVMSDIYKCMARLGGILTEEPYILLGKHRAI